MLRDIKHNMQDYPVETRIGREIAQRGGTNISSSPTSQKCSQRHPRKFLPGTHTYFRCGIPGYHVRDCTGKGGQPWTCSQAQVIMSRLVYSSQRYPRKFLAGTHAY